MYIIKDLKTCDGTIIPKKQYVVLTKATPLDVYIIPIFPKKKKKKRKKLKFSEAQ